jgi:hypothetical protein
MGLNWYSARNGVREGPFDEVTFRARAARGEIAPTDLVWHSGMTEWCEARLIDGLLPMADPAPAAVTASAPPVQAPISEEGAPEDSPATAQVSPEVPSHNYIARHWRGELTLPVSYWVNGFAALMLIGLLSAGAQQIDWTEHPALAAGAAALIVLFSLVVAGWQLVGVWRSAENHPARGGSPGWATVAKVMVVIGCLQTVGLINTTVLPQLRELGSIVAGDDKLSGHTLRVLRDASELEISGPIGFGITKEVERTLDAHPTIAVVHLTSIGGRVEEAKKLARLIEARGLDTHVSVECLSACTLVALAGTERTVTPTAKLGFHGFSFPGMDASALADSTREGVEFMTSRGVERSFAERALAVSGDDMWYPSVAELEAAGVVTGVAGMDQVAVSGLAAGQGEDFEARILKTELFAALREHEPKTYQMALETIREGYQRGRTLLEIRQQVMPAVTEVYSRRLPYGDDAAVIDVAALLVDQLQEIGRQDPALCVRYAGGQSSAEVQLSPELLDREMRVMGQLIRSAATERHGPRPGAVFDAQVERLIGEMTAVWGDDIALLAQIGEPNPSGDPAKICAMLAEMYQRVLELPPAESGQMLRTLFASE